jgi:hypothetical protein
MSGPDAQPSGSSPDRRGERRAVNMHARLVRADGTTYVVELIDLNYGGCGIRTQIPLDVGEALEVRVLGRGSIAAEVRWYADGKAGLLFDPVQEESREEIERAAARIEVPGEVRLRAVGHDAYQVRVFDLSTGGCRVELADRATVGDFMMIKFEGIEVMDADVCWVAGRMAGLKFDQPIHPAVLDLLVERLGGA